MPYLAGREPEALLRALVHSSPLPIIVYGADHNITLWNAAAERVFGWHADEVLGKPIPFIPEDKREEHYAMRARDLQGEGFTERELRRRRKDGSTIYVRVSTEALRDSAGAINAVMCIFVDITDLKRREQRLLAQYNVARILAESSSINTAAPNLVHILCENLGWQAGRLSTPQSDLECEVLCGPPSEQSPSKTGLPERVWETKRPAWNALDPVETGYSTVFAFPILISTAVFGVMEFFSRETLDPDEDLLHMASSIGYQIAEFVERQRAQESLAEREESFRILTETASDGIICIDTTSTILFANTASGRMFGYTREELLGSDLTLLMPEYLRQLHRASIRRYAETGQRHISWNSVPLQGKHKDGREVPLEISFAEYRQDRKHLFIGIIRDITERKRLDEKLRQTAKLESLGLLAGGIAHDFNNLLTGILGNISIASETLLATHPASTNLHDAAEACERAAHLTKQLLAYAGKGRFIIQPLNLSSLVREIVALVKTSIPKNVQLRLDLVEPLLCVEGDATQIQQLIMNLVINGAEAIGQGDGTVLITTNVQDVDGDYLKQLLTGSEITPGKYVSLEVHDTGCGMDPPTVAQIFDPFFTTKFTGRGLGLAAVLGIVRGHNGALKVYSAPGKGSTFKILFPVTDSPVRIPTPMGVRGELEGVGTILVVDDEEIVRKVVKAMLERYGYTVVLAEDGLQASEIFEQLREEVRLVILDLNMPVMNGEETLRRLKLINPTVPILLSSGYNEMEAIQRFAGKGLAGFVQKPYTSTRLAETLRSLLGEKG